MHVDGLTLSRAARLAHVYVRLQLRTAQPLPNALKMFVATLSQLFRRGLAVLAATRATYLVRWAAIEGAIAVHQVLTLTTLAYELPAVVSF